jgi:hypothetical protein
LPQLPDVAYVDEEGEEEGEENPPETRLQEAQDSDKEEDSEKGQGNIALSFDRLHPRLPKGQRESLKITACIGGSARRSGYFPWVPSTHHLHNIHTPMILN